MKLNNLRIKKTIFLYSFIMLHLCMLVSCREEFDNHYKTEGESSISENIIEVLRADSDFSLFVEAIDRLNLATTLGESAIYTCLAPTNANVEAYLKANNHPSIGDIPERELIIWLNYHWISGMYYRYDIEKRSSDIAETESLSFFRSNTNFKTREDSKNPGKQIRLYTSAWLSGRGSDYSFLKNEDIDPTNISVEGISISDRYDISASNGVIHVLTDPLMPLPRADEAIAQDTSLSIVSNWLERYITYSIIGLDEDTGLIDTTKTKGYVFPVPGASINPDLANESREITFIAPTNGAIRKFFAPYLAENFYNEYDSIPSSLVDAILLTSLITNYWGMSDITRGDGDPDYTISVNFSYLRLANEIEPYHVGGISASNAMIYKVSEMVKPGILTSVEGGIYMRQGRYKEWSKMIAEGQVFGLTSPLIYAHPTRTILVQPDHIWTKFVEDFSTEKKPDNNGFSELDTLGWSLNASIIFDNIQNGEFKERTYYNTGHGSIFYENETFTDYLDHSVNLISKENTWEAVNGSIYEIDGFLNPLVATDTNKTIYKKLEENLDSFLLFKTACDLTEVSEDLKQTGYFQYTILAPTDQAFNDVGFDEFTLPLTDIEELKKIVLRHIIQRKIFTDGAYSGNIVNLAGEVLQINGKWENFTVTDASGAMNTIILDKSNKQANNGVIHSMNKLLNEKQ